MNDSDRYEGETSQKLAKRGKPPGATKGLVGVLLEPYYLLFGPAIRCPDCGSTWRGYYSQHMKYCHFCGVEVVSS